MFTTLRRPAIDELPLRSYRREGVTQLTFPIAAALMEGGFVGVVADKIFHAHPGVIAVISAAPMFGNLSSFVWARLAQGRRKVPFIVGLQAVFVALVAAITLVPERPDGVWLLVASMIAARLVLGGIITVRSVVWTLNYPRASRGRVTSRLGLLAVFTMAATSLAGSFVLDADPSAFHLLYGVGALLGTAGVLAFSRVPLVGEDAQLELERRASRPGAAAGDDGAAAPRARGVLDVLRRDPLYARYLSWQFLLGISNMMVEAPLIYLVSRELQASYAESIAITMVIPLGLTVVSLPVWAAYLDRVHISEFRSRHSWLFVAAQLALWVSALHGSLLLIGASRVIVGLAHGGGMLAWQLGHNDFADQEHVGLYMGIHVTLTGLRGAFAPFLGMLFYVGWSPVALPGLGVALPGFAGVGISVLLAASALSTVASLGFVALHRQIEAARA